MSVAAQREQAQRASDREIEAETTRDRERAKHRGDRIVALIDSIYFSLNAYGMVTVGLDDFRVQTFHIVADELYGNGAVDIPPLRTRT